MTMAYGGVTSTDSLEAALDNVAVAARTIRDHLPLVARLMRHANLTPGKGMTWDEVQIEKVFAQKIGQTEITENPQQIRTNRLQIRPQVAACDVLITDEAMIRTNPLAAMRYGAVAQAAMDRLKDQDCILGFHAGLPLGGEGDSAIMGIISAAKSRMVGNDREPAMPPFRCVLHEYQVKLIQDQLTHTATTSNASELHPVENGLTQDVLRNGYMGELFGVGIFTDSNIPRQVKNTGHYALGGLFPHEGMIFVQGMMPRVSFNRINKMGMGALESVHRDQYAVGEGQTVENTWIYSLTSDATLPTS